MTGGIERYFQVAKCIRDEDLRADRGFEFTQLDLEMSFVGQKTVMDTVETMVKKAVWAVGGRLKDENFPVVNYADAMEKYGEDRFDLRSEEEKEEGVLAFAWVVNFPFFKRVDKDDAAEVVDGKSGWTFTHNPFSSPLSEHKEWHEKGERIEEILTAQYDLVCNGYEVGGGSIRAHNPEVLRQTFRIMGYSDAETEESIGHMLMAFELGTPPHGGIALGIDRLIMLLNNEKSLKETIAFPMTATGRTAVMDAPCPVSDQQLKELGIEVRGMSQVAKDHISVFEQIRLYLDKEKIEYSAMEHEPVVTSEDAAKVRGVKLETGAKALVLSADGQPVMAVVSAAHKLDLKKFKKQFDYKDVSMATKELLLEATGLKPGAVPPLGSLFGIKTYVDEELTKVAKIDFSAGSHTQSIEMSSKDYLQVEKPILGEFSK
jgi:Cys-tRNA(Pro) deacylase